MTPEAQTYLKEVWGYDRIEDVDDKTMEVIAENVRENPGDWDLDVELWELFRENFYDRSSAIYEKIFGGSAATSKAR